jgi:hypothetical protein
MSDVFSRSPESIAHALVVNPYYAVVIDEGLLGDHEPSVTEEQWIEANRKLLRAIGDERYLRLLLDVLKGADPVSQQETDYATLVNHHLDASSG